MTHKSKQYKIIHLPTATYIANDVEPDGTESERFYSEFEMAGISAESSGMNYKFNFIFTSRTVLTRLRKLIKSGACDFVFSDKDSVCLPVHFDLVIVKDTKNV